MFKKFLILYLIYFSLLNAKNLDIKILTTNEIDALLENSNKEIPIYKNVSKKEEQAAVIFAGLADAVTSLTDAVENNSKVGLSNFFASIFNTTSQILQINAKYKKQKNSNNLKNFLLFGYMVDLSEYTYQSLSETKIAEEDKDRFPLLAELQTIDNYSDRFSWVADKIIKFDFVQHLLSEVFDYLESYLHGKLKDLFDFMRESVLIDKSIKEESNQQN